MGEARVQNLSGRKCNQSLKTIENEEKVLVLHLYLKNENFASSWTTTLKSLVLSMEPSHIHRKRVG